MSFEDFTPFIPATFVTAKEGPGYVSTVLVKAALAMQPGQVAAPLEEQLFPVGEIYPEGADSKTSSLAYASDFTPLKPNAEVLLTGAAYRPADRPTGDFPAAVRVGKTSKELVVSGTREFQHGVFSSKVLERDPLASVPLTYENAFGGPKYAANPVGRGHRMNDLPLVEYPDQRVRNLGDKAPPAGYGPIAADWEPRKSMIGTYGPDYAAKHWPGYPDDFNPAYFHAAPSDQQIRGYWRGDEVIALENLHPVHATYHTKLPGWRVVCLRENEQGDSELIPLVIDTLWIHPDLEQLILLWRGETRIQTPDAMEIKHLGFLVESISEPLRDVAFYQEQLQKLIEQRDAEFEPEAPPPPPPPADKVAQDAEAKSDPDDDDLYLAQLKAEIAALRAKAGHPPDDPDVAAAEPPPLSPEAQAEYDKIVTKIEAEDRKEAEEDDAARWTREKVIAAVADKTSLDDADLTGLDLSECDFTDADFRGAKLDEASFSGSLLTGAMLTGCSMRTICLNGAKLENATLDAANLEGAQAGGVSLSGAALAGADLSGAMLDGANLAGVSAEEVVLRGASLQRATLCEANLASAVLTDANVTRANLSSAVLTAVAGDGGNFAEADFQNADISDAIFTRGLFAKAIFDGANAADADFSEANLADATFRAANCEGMWLSSAQAQRADFSGAVCIDLQLDATVAPNANFSGAAITYLRCGERADLSGCNFRGAKGADPVFESCRVDGADFSHADLPGANFAHASAKNANFTATQLAGARFDHANCRRATFRTANLFEAIFAGVNLVKADIGQANFYGAEFLDANITGLKFRDANLRMTKLEQWATTNSK